MLYDLTNELQRENFSLRCDSLLKKGAIVELTEKKPQRSVSSNKYLHVILGYFASQTGNTLDYVKQNYYKRLVNPDIFIVEKMDKYLGKVNDLRSSATLTSDEMTLSITRFRNWASTEGGIYLPSPSEERLLRLAEIEVERYKEYL